MTDLVQKIRKPAHMLPNRFGDTFFWMAEIISPRKINGVQVDHFQITADTFQGFQVEHTRPGTYARLRVDGCVMMSDTDMELRSNYSAVQQARGDVLIGGLGLGMMVLPVVRKPEVNTVRVIEINSDVIQLMKPAIEPLTNGKLTIEHGDVKTWKPEAPGRQLDFIYFDIWTSLCVDEVEERKSLHLAYRKYLRPGGRVTSWEYDHLRYLRQQGRWR